MEPAPMDDETITEHPRPAPIPERSESASATAVERRARSRPYLHETTDHPGRRADGEHHVASLVSVATDGPIAGLDTSPPECGTEDGARDWMRANGEILAAYVRRSEAQGHHTVVLRIVESVENRLRGGGRSGERLELLEAAARAAGVLRDPAEEARVRTLLALGFLDAAELGRADEECRAAYALADAESGQDTRAASLECMGIVAQRGRRNETALGLFERVRPLRAATAGPRGAAALDLLSGRSLVSLGRFDHALERLDAALEVFTAPGDDHEADEVDVAEVRMERGRALNGKRRTPQARRELERALAGFEAGGRAYQTAKAREVLAGVDQLAGAEDWREHLVEAVRLYREIGHDAEALRVSAYVG
ncbi:tetratricopeptide repeat protein [Nocardiopsis sp. MG754419]|uniref:tetratricopeptide repeat protein n=1 Tax=Nocardiopsis sp. MG754419 TaxID=2259865 RepID=UPI001BAAAD3D|nr:tetratricopeptide repeat protein [Nocardiopsis sp. MG754419]